MTSEGDDWSKISYQSASIMTFYTFLYLEQLPYLCASSYRYTKDYVGNANHPGMARP